MAIGKGSVVIDREFTLLFIDDHWQGISDFYYCKGIATHWLGLSTRSQWPLAKVPMVDARKFGWLNLYTWGMILFVVQNIA